MRHLLKKLAAGLLCLGLGWSSHAAANPNEKEKEKEKPSKRRLPGEPLDSPRLMLPIDVFDEPATEGSASTQRAPTCPVDEGFRWSRLNGAFGFDEAQAVSTACGHVYTAGYAQGQMLMPDGTYHNSQGNYDIYLRSSTPGGTTEWLEYLGTSTNDYATAVATAPGACPQSTLYVAGYTSGALGGPALGGTDAFIIRYDAVTRQELWRIQFGSNKNDYIYGMTVNAAGEAIVVGATQGRVGSRTPPLGTQDMFVAKIRPNGTIAWAHQMGVDGKTTLARGVSIGGNGHVYVLGYTSGSLGGQPYGGGSSDIFVARYEDLATQGNLLATRLLGTTGADLGYGITTSVEQGQTFAYLTGQTNAAFPGYTNKGSYDIVVAKLAADLSLPAVWLRQVGGPNTDYAYSIVYSNGAVSVAGSSETDLTTNADLGSADMLMLSYLADGSFLFSEHLGGPSRETARGIAADTNGTLFLAGSSDGTLCGETFTGGFFDSLLMKFDNGCRMSKRDLRCLTGGGTGDPHYKGLGSGQAFDFQASGDFVLARIEGDPSFDVQARQCTTSPTSSVATFRSVGALVRGDEVEVLANGNVWVNGVPTTVSSLVLLPNGGALYRNGTAYVVGWPSGERLSAYAYGGFMNIFLTVPKTRQGMMRGLLGDGDNSQDNDFMRRDGSPLRAILSFQEMYRGEDSLASHWRFNAQTDALLLAHGTDCTDLDAPRTYRSVTTLTPQQRAMGETACAAVTDPAIKDDCIMDVGITEDTALVAGATDLLDRLANTGQDATPITKIRGVYFNNFTGEVGPEWDSIVTNVTPLGDRQFLGEFGNQNVQFTLHSLGAHTKLIVSFDLLIINTWTGDDGFFGSPTSWKAAVDGVELINTTFSNWPGTSQSYPIPGSPAQTDAFEADNLGYPYGSSSYRITLEFDHTASDLTLDLSAEGLSGILGEAWGVSNFEIQGR